MQRDDVRLSEERLLAGSGGVAVGARLRQRRLARPYQHVHAEGAAIACDHTADAAVAEDAERLVAHGRAHAALPMAGLERSHLLGDLAHRRQHQRPGQLGGGIGWRAGMLARRHHHAQPGAVGDIDVGIDAALADELELRQPVEQRRTDLGALADQHQRFGVAQPLRQDFIVLHMVGPDRDVVAGELAEGGKRAHGVVIVVEDGDFHGKPRRTIRYDQGGAICSATPQTSSRDRMARSD